MWWLTPSRISLGISDQPKFESDRRLKFLHLTTVGADAPPTAVRSHGAALRGGAAISRQPPDGQPGEPAGDPRGRSRPSPPAEAFLRQQLLPGFGRRGGHAIQIRRGAFIHSRGQFTPLVPSMSRAVNYQPVETWEPVQHTGVKVTGNIFARDFTAADQGCCRARPKIQQVVIIFWLKKIKAECKITSKQINYYKEKKNQTYLFGCFLNLNINTTQCLVWVEKKNTPLAFG